MAKDEQRADYVAAVAGMQAELHSLRETTSSGFDGLNERLDTQNGRLRKVELAAERLTSTVVTSKICEKIRARCAAARSAGWKMYLIPVAASLTVVLIMKLVGS